MRVAVILEFEEPDPETLTQHQHPPSFGKKIQQRNALCYPRREDRQAVPCTPPGAAISPGCF